MLALKKMWWLRLIYGRLFLSFIISGKQTLAMRATKSWYVGETDFFKKINIASRPQILNGPFENNKGGTMLMPKKVMSTSSLSEREKQFW